MTESGFVPVAGGRLYYEVEGDGQALLLIHGGLGSLRMWDGQVAAFAEHYRVIRYDTRGFGRSETDDVEFTNRADAVAVLDHLSAPSAFVVGQSRGAVIGLDLVLERPHRVDAFISVAGGVGGYEPRLPDGATAPPWEEMERLWESKEWNALAELEAQVWVDGWGQPTTRVDAELRQRVHDWILTACQAEKAEGKPQPLDPPAADRLAEVHVPTLVMVGEVDEPGAVAAGRHLAASIGRALLVEFPGVAHMIHLEEPKRFNQLTLDFLAAANRHGIA
jgi:3-oxoadipate enol-lactonase